MLKKRFLLIDIQKFKEKSPPTEEIDPAPLWVISPLSNYHISNQCPILNPFYFYVTEVIIKINFKLTS